MLIIASGMAASCATYHYASNVKMISFDDKATPGKSVGPITGEDCTWIVFNQVLGVQPTIDKAFINAKQQSGFMGSSGLSSTDTQKDDDIRYINNVSTKTTGFNAIIVGKSCLTVTGIGYK